MIAGFLNQGSGLGNQLFRYITTRTLAEGKGFKWGMIYVPDGSGKDGGFKGRDFMKLNLGEDTASLMGAKVWAEKRVIENGVDIRGYDPEINFVQDNTIIEGEFQDPRYWQHNLHHIGHWLEVEPYAIPDDTVAIGFRGGEYSVFPDLFLDKDYWDLAISMFPGFNFEVHTDDPVLARQFFPDYPVIADIGINWRSMRYAKHAIIANSSFYIMPRVLNGGTTIAPRYWARRNKKTWALPQNYYPEFTFI